ncbi:hypothetical protein MTR67_045630 [Solanum verrucosum]|uniref:Uncharacterized protein n=1 Tax=Solanum verrucosum TaxID=315347 RepID=A0AAF0UUF0_SOLVR|nr:hypothetical protein MTR67_045630 [Solanum verrucosum]
MLEEIMRKLMTRTVNMVKFADTWICDIAHMARLILEENKDKSRACKNLAIERHSMPTCYFCFVPHRTGTCIGWCPYFTTASHNSQFTAGQSSQGSSHPEPTSSYQSGPTRFNQPASTTSNNHASSTTVCDDTNRVKRASETAKTSQPPPFVDTSIPITRGITS